MIKQLIKESECLYYVVIRVRNLIKKTEVWYNRIGGSDRHKKRLSAAYKKAVGVDLNWDAPKRYTEKIQLSKFSHDDVKTQLADKYSVREWVAGKIGPTYLIPLIGVYDKADEIDYGHLPQQCVIKTNHGTGSVMIVKDKNKLNWNHAKKILNDWMGIDYGFTRGYELHYSKINRKLLVEKYIEDKDGELKDYKFLCFGGKPLFCWVDLGRFSSHRRNVYDMNWQLQPWTQGGVLQSDKPVEKPLNFDEMVSVAETLCQGFPHVRIDLYNVDGKIYFGEVTFTNGSGLDAINPDAVDFELGALWN